MNSKLFSKLKKLDSPLKIATLLTPVALVGALALEWLITRTITPTTALITIPITFGLTYPVTKVMLHYQHLIDEKNSLLRFMTRDLRRANQIMAAQNADLDAFAQTVAHELKTPLGIIVGYSHLLSKEEYQQDSEKIAEVASHITQTSLKMNSIIQEMLLLANLHQEEEIQAHPLNMEEVINNTLSQLENIIVERKAKITKPDSWPTAFGYAPWIEEVWNNYLSNALKYGGNAPEIELGAHAQADGQIQFWVRDFGPGMTEEEQGQVFSKFTRLDNDKSNGHGLGLSISERIIHKLGGEVGVESQPKNGSTFYFTLPNAN